MRSKVEKVRNQNKILKTFICHLWYLDFSVGLAFFIRFVLQKNKQIFLAINRKQIEKSLEEKNRYDGHLGKLN